MAVSLALPGRIPLADALGRTSSFNAPLIELLEEIQQQHGSPVLVVSSDSFLGGNARRVFAEVPVIPAPALPRFQALLGNGEDPFLLLADDNDRDGRGLGGLLAGLAEIELRAPAAERFTPVSAPARWAPDETYTLYMLALPSSELALAIPPTDHGSAPAEPSR